jgi:phospho-N-acetylmuramoyl-pentapeptide-transferase
VTHVLEAGVLATFLAILLGGKFIGFLRARSLGQNIREEGPPGHKTKQGTPTMGGLLIVSVTAVAFLLFSERSGPGLCALAVTLLCAALGFSDDFSKIVKRRSLGLAGRYKLLLLIPIAALLAAVARHEGVSTDVYLPLLGVHVALGPAWYVLVYLVLAGSTNAVNLTDGLDGLAAGTMSIALLAYIAMAVVAYRTIYVDTGNFDHSRIDLAVFGAALLGSCIGFLWYNSFPADVFMGDTGAFGLGGALAALAVFTKTEILLVLIGGVFVIEALSVIIQVISFRRFGRRVFLMSPIHHHFEMKAWSETKIIVRFWIVAALFAGSGFVLYYLRFSQFA